MKTNTVNRWHIATVLVQCTALFFITFLLSAIPNLWAHTYTALLEGQALPALTDWVRSAVPENFSGMLCLSVIVSITQACIGMMLVTTAQSELRATQRVVFLNAVAWGLILIAVLMVVLAQALPFISFLGRLPTNEELQAEARRTGIWIAGTTMYCLALTSVTVFICRHKGKRGKQPDEAAYRGPAPDSSSHQC